MAEPFLAELQTGRTRWEAADKYRRVRTVFFFVNAFGALEEVKKPICLRTQTRTQTSVNVLILLNA